MQGLGAFRCPVPEHSPSRWSVRRWGDTSTTVWAVQVATYKVQYMPRNMHTVFALLCFVVVIHGLISPYPSGLLHWHCGNLTIAPVPAKQPWWIWINTLCEFIMNDCITTTKQSTTKPCAYFLGYTLCIIPSIVRTVADLWFFVDDLSAHFTHPMWTLGQWVIQQWIQPNESNQIHWMGAELFIKSKTEWGKMRCNRNHCQLGVYSPESNAFTSSSGTSEMKKKHEKKCTNNWNPLHTYKKFTLLFLLVYLTFLLSVLLYCCKVKIIWSHHLHEGPLSSSRLCFILFTVNSAAVGV